MGFYQQLNVLVGLLGNFLQLFPAHPAHIRDPLILLRDKRTLKIRIHLVPKHFLQTEFPCPPEHVISRFLEFFETKILYSCLFGNLPNSALFNALTFLQLPFWQIPGSVSTNHQKFILGIAYHSTRSLNDPDIFFDFCKEFFGRSVEHSAFHFVVVKSIQ